MSHPEPLTEQQLDEIDIRAEGIASQLSGWLDRFAPLAGEERIDRARNVLTEDVPALLADLRRARDRVAELEAYAYGCDAEGCVLPHSSWCDAAKKTAAANEGCTCGKPWTGHPQPHAMHCWTVNPPRAEVEEMRKRIAELSAEVSTGNAAPAPATAPLAASQPSEVPTEPETATEAPEGRVGDSGPDAAEDPGWCTFGEDDAPGAGCILPAGHQPPNRHLVTPGDTDDHNL